MRTTLLLLVFLLPGLAAPPEPVHRVTFKAVTAFGQPVPVHVTALSDPINHRELAAQCAGVVCDQIPEGPYRYAITIDETGRKVEGTAVVYRTNQIVVVDVGTPASDTDEASFPSIEGQVVNTPDPSKVWIRLQQLYSDMSVSASVEKSGTFKLDQVRPGNWMLLVFLEGKLVHFEPFTCRDQGNPPLRLNLKGVKPVMKGVAPGSSETLSALASRVRPVQPR
jgi:hypothetical protein